LTELADQVVEEWSANKYGCV